MFVPRVHVLRSPTLVAMAVRTGMIWAETEGIKDYNVIVNCGELASQTVPHDHVHIVPRREDDGLRLPWTDDSRLLPWTDDHR